MTTLNTSGHKWEFAPRFRRDAFGWRSQPAIKRVKEAVREIKKHARRDPLLAGEGAVLFLEKISLAIQRVDGSSGGMGASVNWAVSELASVIATAPADDIRREKWLQRLWQAIEDDDIPYIETLAEYWGELCATEMHASKWANEFEETLRRQWSPGTPRSGWFKGTYACLSALFAAGRHDELFELVEMDPHNRWNSRRWGVRALADQGKIDEALAYAEDIDDSYRSLDLQAITCEAILLSVGRDDEAYARYAVLANRKGTNLATFRAIAKKYPSKSKSDVLKDLVKQTPGSEGKWFAAAKSVGLYDDAIILANTTPCDPKTLTRAARDFAETNPVFAMEAGLAALRWLLSGHGYEISALDVRNAYDYMNVAAGNAGKRAEASESIERLLLSVAPEGQVVAKVIADSMARDRKLRNS